MKFDFFILTLKVLELVNFFKNSGQYFADGTQLCQNSRSLTKYRQAHVRRTVRLYILMVAVLTTNFDSGTYQANPAEQEVNMAEDGVIDLMDFNMDPAEEEKIMNSLQVTLFLFS